MPEHHAARVAAVARQLTSRPPGSRITIRKPTPTHSIRDQAYKQDLHSVDVGALHHILEIDPVRRLARVEGQVTMGELAAAALAQGLLPPVVPEFRKFTVSGLINGEGIQSSSHRYGVFTHTIESIDVLTADGEVVTASASSNQELFAALPESLGTLGLVVAATIRLIPAKRFVRLTYQRFEQLEDYVAAFRASLGIPDFHEGVIFGPRHHVLLTGEFADEPGEVVFDVEREGGPYYFQHVRALTRRQPIAREAMPTLEYLARPERGLWWMLESHIDFPLLSETAWGRRLIDKDVTKAYNRHGFVAQDVTTSERERSQINQDIGVRLERLGEGVRWIQQHLAVYPIWNCATLVPPAQRSIGEGSSHLVDLGVYGEPQVADYRRVAAMRALQSMGDAPSLWGLSYRSWEELEAAFPDRYARYARVRQRFGADRAFLHLRDKVVWVDPATPDPGPIRFWRLQRAFGARWYVNPLALGILATGVVTKRLWRHQ